MAPASFSGGPLHAVGSWLAVLRSSQPLGWLGIDRWPTYDGGRCWLLCSPAPRRRRRARCQSPLYCGRACRSPGRASVRPLPLLGVEMMGPSGLADDVAPRHDEILNAG